MLSTGGRPLLPHDGTAASTPSASGEDGESSTTTGSRKKINRVRLGINPTPNEDGKFACDLCGKLYQHSKHLKRHMLRHTGARPYSCGLCGDDFARSDILKRHFEKCTVRRGNPNGIGHLDATRENRERESKRKQEAARASGSQEGTPSADEAKSGNRERKGSGKACDNCVKNKVGCDLGVPCSKCNSRSWECTYTRNHRRSSSEFEARGDASLSPGYQQPVYEPAGHGDDFHFPPVRHPHIHMTGQAHERQRFEQQTPASTSASVPAVSGLLGEDVKLSEHSQQQPHSTLFDGGKLQPGRLSPGRVPPPPDLLDWNNLVPTYAGFFPSSDVETPPGTLVQHSGDGYDNLLYHYASNPFPPPMDPMPLLWPPESIVPHALRSQCDRLVSFLFADQSASSPMSSQLQQEYAGADIQDLKEYLVPENVEHFVNLYFENFEHHFPMIHRPTFDPTRAHDGLLMAIICVGAVYSKCGITVQQVRRFLDYLYLAMTRRMAPSTPDGQAPIPEIEDVQAMILLYILLTWHGNEKQRRLAQVRYDVVVEMARRATLFRTLNENELRREYEKTNNSYYRQIPDYNFDTKGLASWSWLSWVAQERRNRCAYTVYLLDTAYVIYYNAPPKIEPSEIDLPLPTDDAMWEATDGSSCAAALELSSSHQPPPRKVMLNEGVQLCMSSAPRFPADCTNGFAKFIIIHSLHVQLWLHHKHAETGDSRWMQFWLGQEPDSSTHATLTRAFGKWIAVWEDDFKRQFPDPKSRRGFSRDGTPYYHLGVYLLQYTDRTAVGYGPPGEPANIKFTFDILQRSRLCQQRVESSTQPVKKVFDENYGVEELAYDMRLLFRPVDTSEDEE